MAYIKNNWVDREGVIRYFETIDEDGALIFTPDFTLITERGTPVNADNMNHIEDGIDDHETRITKLEKGGAGMPIGSIFQAIRTDIPENCLRLDGTEYTAGFNDFVEKFLATGKIIAKTFDEWNVAYNTNGGNVGFFAYNAATGAFKVPCIQAGTFLAQAVANGEFGSFLNSELKSHSHTQDPHSHTRGTQNITGWANGIVLNEDATGSAGGALYLNPTNLGNAGFEGDGEYNGYQLGISAQDSWTGETSHAQPTIHATGGADTYPKHIRYPFFVVVSNVEAESPSQVVWDNFVGNLDSKLGRNNKEEITNWSFPSNVFTDLSLGVSETQYIAPADGWFAIRADGNSQYSNITMTNVENGLAVESSLWNGQVFQGHASIKVSKGQSVFISYNDISTVFWFRFIYAKGAV